MSEEQRRYPRNEPPTVVTVHDAVEQRALGTLGNVSGHGLMLITDRALEEELLLQLEFEISSARDVRRSIRLGAESLWCSPASQPGRYFVGFEIVDIDPTDERFLDRLNEV